MVIKLFMECAMKNKSNSRKQNKKKIARYDCIHNGLTSCYYSDSTYYNRKCPGNIFCHYYQQFHSNPVFLHFNLSNNQITINVILRDVKLTDFELSYKSHYAYFKCRNIDHIIIKLDIKFLRFESYICFIFGDKQGEIRKIKNNISIQLKNNRYVERILDLPYAKLPKLICIKSSYKDENLEYKIELLMPKKYVFDQILLLKRNKSDRTKEKEPIHKTVKIPNVSKEPIRNSALSDNKQTSHCTEEKRKPATIEIGITAIVISDNRKCIYNEHSLYDVVANIRIADSDGKIILHKIPAAYCEDCDSYFVLKEDFEIAKKIGVILCPVIDKRSYTMDKKYKIKNNSQKESRIHQLGYNVQKGNNYTMEQRQVVLANIIENTNITTHEIMSLIKRCINQHQKQANYAEAVKCWSHDYDFMSSYKKGDMKEVIIEKIKMGR